MFFLGGLGTTQLCL